LYDAEVGLLAVLGDGREAHNDAALWLRIGGVGDDQSRQSLNIGRPIDHHRGIVPVLAFRIQVAVLRDCLIAGEQEKDAACHHRERYSHMIPSFRQRMIGKSSAFIAIFPAGLRIRPAGGALKRQAHGNSR
jgi:hypothetical protein